MCVCVCVCVCVRACVRACVRVSHLPPLPLPPHSTLRLTELHDENALPHKDLQTLQYRSQGEGQDNFTLTYPRERDTPEEGSDFSEFEHLDSEDGGGEGRAYYLDSHQEFVVVDDMTKLVEPDEEDLTDFRHSAPDDWFDDPAYAQINTLHNQQAGRNNGRSSVCHTHAPSPRLLPYSTPSLPFSPLFSSSTPRPCQCGGALSCRRPSAV